MVVVVVVVVVLLRLPLARMTTTLPRAKKWLHHPTQSTFVCQRRELCHHAGLLPLVAVVRRHRRERKKRAKVTEGEAWRGIFLSNRHKWKHHQDKDVVLDCQLTICQQRHHKNNSNSNSNNTRAPPPPPPPLLLPLPLPLHHLLPPLQRSSILLFDNFSMQ